MSLLKYMGYEGSAEVSVEDGVVFGKILHIRDLVNYESERPSEIEDAFRRAVDDYLEDCEVEGREPDKPFKGSFNVRVSSNLHRDLVSSARRFGVTLNEYVSHVLVEHKSCRRFHNDQQTMVWTSRSIGIAHAPPTASPMPSNSERKQNVTGEFSVSFNPGDFVRIQSGKVYQ